MKKGFIIVFAAFLSNAAQSQVSWNYSVNKLEGNSYELHITAEVAGPWHIYSQQTPAGGPVPTEIRFNTHPLVQLEGKTQELGKLITRHEEVFSTDVKYYDARVDFVQLVKLKAKAKTSITGSVKYMVCNDKECLPPKTAGFTIQIP